MINSSHGKECIIKRFPEPQEHFCTELQLNIPVSQEEWEAYETKNECGEEATQCLKTL